MLDIVGKRLWFFILSAVLIVVSVVALLVLGLEPGIDFSSGSILTLSFEQSPAPALGGADELGRS